jgi:hypothetical protein
VDIDFRSLWLYRPVFTSWFVPTLLLANFIYVRRRVGLSSLEALGVDIAMTALSWLFIAGVPVMPMAAWVLVLTISGHGLEGGPVIGLVPVFAVAVLISTISQFALLRCLKHRIARSEFWILAGINLVCLVTGFYRMCAVAFAHPPAA